MKCLNCGKKIEKNWMYCPDCGASVYLSKYPEAHALSVCVDIFRPDGEFLKGLVARQRFGPLAEMWEAVAAKIRNEEISTMPKEVSNGYIVSIDIPEHPYNHPHLIIL